MAEKSSGGSAGMFTGNVISAIGSTISALDEMDSLRTQALWSDRAALDSAARGREGARRIRLAGQQVRGAARADVAASGLKVDTGTTADIEKNIMERAESDALMAIFEGEHGAAVARAEAAGKRKDARSTGVNAAISFAGSLIGSSGSLPVPE